MTISEWEGTPWSGTDAPSHSFAVQEAKATNSVFGPGASFYAPGSVMLSSLRRSPLKIMREAQALYHSNPWIGIAERTVTRKVAGMPWHLESESDEEVDDETVDPFLQDLQRFFEKPQAALPLSLRQPAISTFRSLMSITSRHAGLCGVSYWYLDEMDGNGWPKSILYINPARLLPLTNGNGNLQGYSLDPKDDDGRGGTLLRPDEVLPFYLEVPDFGVSPVGLVEAAALDARIMTSADMHSLYVLGSGGRIAGILSPKSDYITDNTTFDRLVADVRSVNDAPDAAKRTTIVRGPIDFNKTAGDPQELGIPDMSERSRDDILGVWGVPLSQTGGKAGTTGLNSGETRRYEYEVLMTGAVHDRIRMFSETIQYQLLDRLQGEGRDPQIVYEEPNFDDDQAAPYELANQAKEQPLTVNERRDILLLPPLPDYGPDGKPLGLAILLPSLIVPWAQGAEENKEAPFANAPAEEETPAPVPAVPVASDVAPPDLRLVKASLDDIRPRVESEIVPEMSRDIASFLERQKAAVMLRVDSRAQHIQSKPSDSAVWWNERHWDAELASVMAPHLGRIASMVLGGAQQQFAKGRFEDEVARQVLDKVGIRISGINETTRLAVAEAIKDGIANKSTISDVVKSISDLFAFDPARSETIARTESGTTYNVAAVASYREYKVDKVEVIDGDRDEICAAANGSIWTLERAESEPLGHPNCTRDFSPYLA